MLDVNPYESPACIEDGGKADLLLWLNEFHQRLEAIIRTCVKKTQPVRAYVNEQGNRAAPFIEAGVMSGATGLAAGTVTQSELAGITASAVTAIAFIRTQKVFNVFPFTQG